MSGFNGNISHPHDIESCPNPACTYYTWHGLAIGTDEQNANKPSYSKTPYCPGSHLFNDDGTKKEDV
jgi:hypothetical protein